MRKRTVGETLRYVLFFSILILALSAIIAAGSVRIPTQEIKLYFVDAQIMCLMPVKTTIPAMTTEKTAQRVLDELIEGRDENPKIRRLIPKIKRCMTVRVKDNTAYVDIKRTLIEAHPEGRDLEILTVYSIVNSLTDLDGITTVRFTIDGKAEKSFMGYLDMRETFVPDFFV